MSSSPLNATDLSATRFDPDLLDRMTGALGDRVAIETKARAIQAAIAQALSINIHNATGIDIDVRPGEIRRGRRRALLEALCTDSAYCEAAIRGWSTDLRYLCGSKLVIALVECLLGGSDPDALEVTGRPLSGIELDMSLVVFEQLNDALKAVVLPEPKLRAMVSRPGSAIPALLDDPVADFHATAITLSMEFGAVVAPIVIILPQSVMLKTKITPPPRASRDQSRSKSEWAERMNQRVVRSEVGLEARIALEPMRLGEISLLQPGDVLTFKDVGDIKVTLGANGKDLYSCALGRSGQRYMIRVETPVGPDEDWKSAFV